jgi:hypothetical protein
LVMLSRRKVTKLNKTIVNIYLLNARSFLSKSKYGSKLID